MTNYTDAPFAEFMEEAVKTIFEQDPTKIAICATMPDETTLTAYYQCDAQDMAVFAHHINSDAMLEVVLNNIGMVKEALEEYEGEDCEDNDA